MIVPTDSDGFERCRREAKRLLKNLQDGDQAARTRVTHYWPAKGGIDKIHLAQIQLVIARERGYRSWTHLKTSLLENKENIMPEQKNAPTQTRRLGVYTDAEAASLLDIPKEQIRRIAEEIEKKPPQYLDAVLLEKIWAAAKPYIVTLKSTAPTKRIPEEHIEMLQEAILSVGGTRAMSMVQWRFATLEEAERKAQQQSPIAGYIWVALAWGYATIRQKDGNKFTFHVEGRAPEDDLAGLYPGLVIPA